MNKPAKRTCGAKNRQGEPCKVAPMKGKKRCRLHGGKTPSSQNAGEANGNRKHGLYSSTLNDDELVLWDAIKFGSVDDEIRLCRIQLNRAMALEAKIGMQPNDTKNLTGFDLVEMRKTAGDKGTSVDIVSRRPDISGRMNWLIGRIAQLEKTRSELLSAARLRDEDPEDVGRRLMDTVAAMTRVEFGEYWDSDSNEMDRKVNALASAEQRRLRGEKPPEES